LGFDPHELLSILVMLSSFAKATGVRLMHYVGHAQKRKALLDKDLASTEQAEIPPTIALAYRVNSTSLDVTERSALFWFPAAGIPLEELLYYKYRSVDPADRNRHKPQRITFRRNTGGSFTHSTAWQPTELLYTIWLRCMMNLMSGVGSCFCQRGGISSYYLHYFLHLAYQYAYWYDFYAKNRILVDVDASFLTGGIATAAVKIMAMEAQPGVSAVYQYAVGFNILTLQTNVNTGEDIQFVFSRWMEQTWRSMGTPWRSYVHVGYVYDSVFQHIRAGHFYAPATP
jgi:hypothetical protein